jgi:putative acetyltransferase
MEATMADDPTTTIDRAGRDDRDPLVGIWLRSVRATHGFLTEDDIQGLLPEVRDYLHADDPELWVLRDAMGAPLGFMGMAGSDVAALFLAPEHHRRGGGRRLIRFAQDLRGELTVSVNEQNPGAIRFYEACGFVVESRSATDDDGRPYPLLRMRLAAPVTA